MLSGLNPVKVTRGQPIKKCPGVNGLHSLEPEDSEVRVLKFSMAYILHTKVETSSALSI